LQGESSEHTDSIDAAINDAMYTAFVMLSMSTMLFIVILSTTVKSAAARASTTTDKNNNSVFLH
jgi:uncharacterized membrane protein